jgi:hypothetical protein
MWLSQAISRACALLRQRGVRIRAAAVRLIGQLPLCLSVDRSSSLPLSLLFLLSFVRILTYQRVQRGVGRDQGRIGRHSTRVFDQPLLLALLDDPAALDLTNHFLAGTSNTASYRNSKASGYMVYFFRVSRKPGDSAKVKITTSSAVVVLMSWCRLITLTPVM